jgi:FkbM family methyltransferase
MKQLLRSVLNKCGIEIRLVKNMHAQLRDAFLEQQRLAGKNNVNVVFDIGAYDGGTALKYKQYFPNSTVYSFEPFPITYAKLKETAQKHLFIKPINAAVAEKVGNATLHVNSMDATNSLLPSETTNSYLDDLTKPVDKVNVATTTVDFVCEENRISQIDILKIDVQGNGLAVLKGAEKMLREKKIKLIYIEIEFIQIYKGQPLMFELTDYLNKYNYSLFGLYNLVHQKSGQLAWGDAIYYCDELESSIRSMN